MVNRDRSLKKELHRLVMIGRLYFLSKGNEAIMLESIIKIRFNPTLLGLMKEIEVNF